MTFTDRALDVVARVLGPSDQRISKEVSFTSRGSTTVDALMYRETRRWSNSSVAYRSIHAIAGNAASLRLQVLNSDDVEVDHELSALWAQPNPLISGRVFGEYVWQRLETRGETFVYVDRGDTGTGTPTGLWPIFGDVHVVVDKNLAGEIVGYYVDVGYGRIHLLPSEVVWLRYPDGDNEWGCMAPLDAAAHAIQLDYEAARWQRGELRNGARPSAVVYLGDLEPNQHDETVQAFRSRMEGAQNAGRTLFVSSATPAKVERMSLTPAELGWLDTRSSAWDEVMLGFGIPRDYLLGGATYENRNAARATLWSDTIVPKLEVVAGELARQLLPDGFTARFDTDDVDALHETADAVSARTNSAVVVDVMTIDEARATYGLEPLPGGIGTLTLTAYRTGVTLEAQSTLMQITSTPNGKQLPRARQGADDEPFMPQLALPAEARNKRAGLTFDQAQDEYGMHERVGMRAVKRLSSRQEKIVLNNLHKLYGRSAEWKTAREQVDAGNMRAAIDKLLDAEAAEKMTATELEAFLHNVWTRGGSTTAKALGMNFDLFEVDVLLEMDERRLVLAGQVTETTRQVLEDRVLLQGVANGESVDQLAIRVRSVYTDLSSWRATMIARTETVGGFNASSHRTASDSGVAVARVWLATGDSRTRDSHVTADGETLHSFDAKYSTGCRFPGDPAGPPEETIMCRCCETYETE